MIDNISGYEAVLDRIIQNTRLLVSDLKPSEWYEKNMVMPRGSAFPGPFSFDRTPYWREPLDCAAKEHPAKEISIMKGAQVGGTVAVLNPIVGYTMAQNPGNTMFLTGHSDLTQAAFLKIDQMIDNCGIRHLIRPNVVRAKNSRSGDTDMLKEFAGGSLWGGSVTNHNLLRQYDVMIMIVDDFDAAATSSKFAGSTRELVQKRTSAFMHKKKIFYVSSPQIKNQSNIENVFLLGDQRYWNVPCPCCGAFIVLQWNVQKDGETAGITWKIDENSNIVKGSVGYVCQECAGFFTDSHKYEMNLAGFWKPTVVPKEENHWSYQISTLYAPAGMDNWQAMVQRYINANPIGAKVNQKAMQTFVNVDLGLTFEEIAKTPDATALQKNVRNYQIGEIPEWVSQKDGNGEIVMITLASDLNGTEQDARLDWEIVAWSESGASYSVKHGSIGTFVRNEGTKEHREDRQHWTYEIGRTWSVWPELKKIIEDTYLTDTDRKMKIVVSGIDTGHFTNFAFEFIDSMPFNVIGLKGDKESKFRKMGIDVPIFKQARERSKLYLLDVNHVKDLVSTNMELNWVSGNGEQQPSGFMNYPSPSDGLYQYSNYFSHFQSEKRTIENKNGEPIGAMWVKKQSKAANHHWDVFVYNYALKELWAHNVLRESGQKNTSWADFVRFFKSIK